MLIGILVEHKLGTMLPDRPLDPTKPQGIRVVVHFILRAKIIARIIVIGEPNAMRRRVDISDHSIIQIGLESFGSISSFVVVSFYYVSYDARTF